MSKEVSKRVEFYKKLAKIKEEIGGVVLKNAENPYFQSRYADLNTHIDLIEPVLKKYGIVMVQPIIGDLVVTQLIDTELDDIVTFNLKLPPTEDMQKLGGAITYARRYLLTSYFVLKAEDDDGETAVGRADKMDTKKTKPIDKKFKKPVKDKTIQDEELEELF